MSEQTMVEVPKARLQRLEILYHTASAFYSAYYRRHREPVDIATTNDFASALSVIAETDDDNWEGWELQKAYDRLDDEHETLKNEIYAIQEKVTAALEAARQSILFDLNDIQWPDLDP